MNAHLQFPCLLLSSSEGIITKALKIMSDSFRHIQFCFSFSLTALRPPIVKQYASRQNKTISRRIRNYVCFIPLHKSFPCLRIGSLLITQQKKIVQFYQNFLYKTKITFDVVLSEFTSQLPPTQISLISNLSRYGTYNLFAIFFSAFLHQFSNQMLTSDFVRCTELPPLTPN